MNRVLLTEEQISERLESLQGWWHQNNEIGKTFQFHDFTQAIGFVVKVALAAERADHHPNIDIRWNKVAIVLSTHSAGGLTTLDFELATHFDHLGKIV